MTQGVLIIYASPNGRDEWQPVLPADVPEFVKDPDTLGRLVAGEMCCDAETQSLWYRAEQVKDERPAEAE